MFYCPASLPDQRTLPRLLFISVIKQVIFQRVGKRQAEDLLSQAVCRRFGLQFRKRFFHLFPAIFLQFLTVIILQRVGDPACKDLFVQEDNGFHAAVPDAAPFKPRRVSEAVAVFAGSVLVDQLFNGAADGNPSQVLQAANHHRGWRWERGEGNSWGVCIWSQKLYLAEGRRD